MFYYGWSERTRKNSKVIFEPVQRKICSSSFGVVYTWVKNLYLDKVVNGSNFDAWNQEKSPLILICNLLIFYSKLMDE